jgi:hypothetical protein
LRLDRPELVTGGDNAATTSMAQGQVLSGFPVFANTVPEVKLA